MEEKKPFAENPETEKILSPEELDAQKTMENIFKTVEKNKAEAVHDTVHDTASDEARLEKEEVEVPKEIELMTVTTLTDSEKRAEEKKKELEKKKKNQSFIKRAILGALVVVLVIAGGYFYADYVPGASGGEVVVTVAEGSGTASIARELKRSGLINSEGFFRVMSKLRGKDGKYNFGKFKLLKSAGYEEIFKTLTQAGQIVDAVKVTIPEGYEIYKIADLLESKGLIDKDKFYYLIDYGEFHYDFVDDIPFRENRLEGYLFPDTYNFAPNDEQGIINEMLSQFDKVYKKYEDRAKEMGMTMDEVITLASIVEREAMGDSDRKLVSSVFHNRIKSTDYPYLQSCATVQYILKERKPVLSVADTKIDSPYNTYINKGLPIGPIASPGEEAIEATLYPEESDYLFFVLGADGKHHFSKTFDEHIKNKQ